MKERLALTGLLPNLPEMKDAIVAALKEQGITPEGVQVKRVVCSTKLSSESSGDTITAYASTRDMDRDNEILMPRGVNLKEWEKTGVILEGHDYHTAQVGKAISAKPDDYGVRMKIQFAPTEEGQKYAVLSKFMPLSFSVGFIPTDVIDKSHAEWPDTLKTMNREWPEFKKTRDSVIKIYRKWTMLETSVVPVPANPNAIQTEMAKALEAGTIKEEDARIIRKAFEINEPVVDLDPAKELGDLLASADPEDIRAWLDENHPKAAPPPEPKPSVMVVQTAREYKPVVKVLSLPGEQVAEQVAEMTKEKLELMKGAV